MVAATGGPNDRSGRIAMGDGQTKDGATMKKLGVVLALALASTMMVANVSHAKHKKHAATKGEGQVAPASGGSSGGGKAHAGTHGHGKGKPASEGAGEAK